jgi:hypothetical protein
MKKTIIFLAFLFLIMATAFFTNPTPAEHKAAVKEVLHEHLKKSMNSNFPDLSDDQNGASALGMMFGGALVEMLVENMVTSKDYFLFSITQTTWKNNTRNLGVGLFGRVMISDELEEYLNTISEGEETPILEEDEDPTAINDKPPFVEEEEEITVEDAEGRHTLTDEQIEEMMVNIEGSGSDLMDESDITYNDLTSEDQD